MAAVKYRRLFPLHTWLNKLTGGAVFLLPYVLGASAGIAVYSRAVCILALAASVEELAIHLRYENYCADRRSILDRRRNSNIGTPQGWER